ncbi:MAG: radical SAM protein [Nanoarchaeota archaeon]
MKIEQVRGSWKDWQWQQKNAVRDIRILKENFPNVRESFFDELNTNSGSRLKFQMTPYMISQIPEESDLKTLLGNPWVKQFFPLGRIYVEGKDAYDGTDNWEKAEEFPTKDLHHKYTNRVLIRLRNCLAYCNYCFESLGVLEKEPSDSKSFVWAEWQRSLEYIRDNPDVEEVILSGGEPLLMTDGKLEKILEDICLIRDPLGQPKVRFKRIHTRVLTHNPYRITSELVSALRKFKVNEIALHVAHPSEITSDFIDSVERIREGMGRVAPIIAVHTPLIKGLNDSKETLWELFSRLYENNIKPYYLIHSMPHIPYGNQQRLPVKTGVQIMRSLKRHKSNIALPEYIIAHYDGKQTVPLELDGTPEFQYLKDSTGGHIVRFLNWKRNWVEYPDAN